MTNVKSNVYATACVEMSKRDFSAANKKKAQKCVLLASSKDVAALLKKAKVDASLFSQKAIYSTEKSLETATQIVATHADASKNRNMLYAMKCAALCAEHNAHMRKDDITHALLNSDLKFDETRAHLIYARHDKIKEKVQVDYCMQALRAMNVIKQITRETYEVDANNAILQAFNEKFAQIAV